MIIKKYQGDTREDALESARKELGEGLVEMNVKTVKNNGVKGWFKKNLVEVTVAKEEENEVNQKVEGDFYAAGFTKGYRGKT
jgi:flagellar biosynthesis protein FlhF